MERILQIMRAALTTALVHGRIDEVSLISIGMDEVERLEQVIETPTMPIPAVMCAWCMSAAELAATQNASHGICPRCAASMIARRAARLANVA